MASMQSFFHNDSRAYRYGASHSNQRTENLWSHYKWTYTTWIINFFKDLVNINALRLGDHFQMECAWFVFSDLLPAELVKMKEEWNTHRIRRSSYAEVAGIPDEMYFLQSIIDIKNVAL